MIVYCVFYCGPNDNYFELTKIFYDLEDAYKYSSTMEKKNKDSEYLVEQYTVGGAPKHITLVGTDKFRRVQYGELYTDPHGNIQTWNVPGETEAEYQVWEILCDRHG
jgi:hypothetical protein